MAASTVRPAYLWPFARPPGGHHHDGTQCHWEETFMSTPDLILHHGLFTTLDRGNPTASAVAIKDGMFVAVGHDSEVIKLAGPSTRVIDLKGKRVLPGLIDNHLHIIRGGLNFNLELRWDGVRSL